MGVQHLPVPVDVVPDDELVEGQISQEHQLFDVPAPLVHHGAADGVHHPPDGDVPVLFRQPVQPRDADPVLLPEHFQQRQVRDDVLAGPLDAPGRLGDFHGNQENRGEVRRDAVLIQPFQGTDRQVQRVGPVLLQVVPGLLPDGIQLDNRRLFGDVGMEPSVHHLLVRKLAQRVLRGDFPEEALGAQGARPSLGDAEDMEARAAFQHPDHLFRAASQQLEDALLRVKIDQVVPEAQVQQFPLPDGVLVHGGGPVQVDLVRFRNPLRNSRPVHRLLIDDVAVRGQDALGDRTDAGVAGRADIDIQQETVHVRDHTGGLGGGLIECQPIPFQESRRLHQQDLVDAVRAAFAQDRRVIVDRIGRGLLDQPRAGVGVPLVYDDQRAQAHGLQAARVQERGVQAGGEFPGKDILGKAHPLPAVGEGGRRIRISDAFPGKGLIEGRHLHLHPVPVAGLVAFQRGFAGPCPQSFGGRVQDGADCRMIREDEGRSQFRGGVHPLPEIVRKQGHRILLPDTLARHRGDGHRHPAFDPFGQVGKISGGREYFDMVQDQLSFGRQFADVRLVAFGKGRIEPDGQLHFGQGFLPGIAQDDAAHRRHAILHPGIAESLGIVGLEGHRIQR